MNGKIDKNAVFDFLLWGNLFSIEEKSSYVLPYKNCKGGYNEYEEPFYVDKTRQLLLDSVQNSIEGKDKIALMLDNQIHSAALLCCIRKLNRDISLTAFIHSDLLDDREHFLIENLMKETKVDLVKIKCDKHLIIKQLIDANKSQDMPVANVHSVFQYNFMAAAKQHGFDVVMDSQGADELFAGYSDYFPPFFKSLRSQWMFTDWLNELLHLGNSPVSFKEIVTKKLTNRTKPQALAFFNKEYVDLYLSRSQCIIENKSVLNDYLYESFTCFLPSFIRFKKNRAANFEMDCLSPFSNSKALAECIFSIPSTFKIHNGWNNYLLRASMVGIVPDEIRWRKQKSDAYFIERKLLNKTGNELKKQISQLEDTDNFIDKHTLLKKWDSLYKSENIHFQKFAFRYFSYLIWRNEVFR